MPGASEVLAQIPFQSLIAGPLKAVVVAQAEASYTTLHFLQSDAILDKETNEIRTVFFRFTKSMPGPDGAMQEQKAELAVPILTLLPIPHLRVAEVNIDFNAEIVSTNRSDYDFSSEFEKTTSESSGKPFFGLFGGTDTEMKTSFKRKTDFHSESSFSEKYTMNIKVRAVQDALPAGMDRVLSMLEHCIKERPPQGDLKRLPVPSPIKSSSNDQP